MQAAIEIPYCFAQAVIYGGIVYSMIGYEWTTTKYLWFMYFMFFTLIYFVYYGMMAVAMTPNHHIANIVSYSFYGFWNLFSGFIVPRPVSHDSRVCVVIRDLTGYVVTPQMTPVWWRWYHWANPVAWTFGFRHDFIGVVAVVVAGFGVVFALIFAFAIRTFNFQRR